MLNDATLMDIARIEEIWRDCRKTYGKGEKFLFGRFCIADAMFAPVITRFETYAIPVAKDTNAYMNAVLATRLSRNGNQRRSRKPGLFRTMRWIRRQPQ